FLLEFHFTITYQPGKLAVVPDALSRQDNVYPREGKFYLNSMTLHSKTLKLQDAQLSDPCCRDIRSNITLYSKNYSISKHDLLLYKEKIVVPDNPSLKLSILKSRHNSPLADFSWLGMTRDIKDYVNSCYDCNCKEASNHQKYGNCCVLFLDLSLSTLEDSTESLHSLSSRVQRTN
ncbi:transposon Tf2-11 polyprotein type 1, partial [Puccinia sorghi]